MDNIIEIKEWAKAKLKNADLSEVEKEIAFWTRTYKAMDFHSLILEANTFITELRAKELSKGDWARARAILQEIETRMVADGRPEAKDIRIMAQDLEARLEKLAFL